MDAGEILGEAEVTEILDLLEECFLLEENIVSIRSPVVICGDVHGQYEDAKLIFTPGVGGDPREHRFLFMGDYVDRGHYSLNTFLLLAIYKLQYRDTFFMLRGNHETRQVTQQYGFMTEILSGYGHSGLWLKCMRVFDLLPIAAIIDTDVFSVHGGLSPELVLSEALLVKNRQKEIGEKGMIADLTWSDRMARIHADRDMYPER
jgi:diadenosine tetraphosphatase ApaH/serine/threonine PP2A family protein phosphatase